MYRFLDKHFHHRRRLEYDLRPFACEHVGLSRGYDAGKIKEKLRPALEELEALGFLEPLSPQERYVRLCRGSWRVIFVHRAPATARPTRAVLHTLERELVRRGVTPATATELVAAHPAERLRVKLEVFDWLVANGSGLVSRNPAGYLVQSIRDDYAPPKGFQAAADRIQRRQAEEDRRTRREEAQRRREAEAEARREAEAYPVARYYMTVRDCATAVGSLYAEGVALRSPGSRSASWYRSAPTPIYAEGVGQPHRPALCNPCGVGGGWRALPPRVRYRDPGLRHTTASR